MTHLILAIAAASVTTQSDVSLDKLVEEALGNAGLTTQTATFDERALQFIGGSRHRTALFEATYADPWRTHLYVDAYRRQIAASVSAPQDVVSIASVLLGQGTRRSLLGSRTAANQEIARRDRALEGVLATYRSRGLITDLPTGAAEVPEPVQRAAALVLLTALETKPLRDAAFARLEDLNAAFDAEIATPDPTPTQELQSLDRSDAVELSYILAAGQDLAEAVAVAESWSDEVPPTTEYRFEARTIWGRIILTGGFDDAHDSSATLLLIDTGGDDVTIGGPRNLDARNWLSAHIDVAGTDAYLSHEELAEIEVAEWSRRTEAQNELGPGSAAFGLTFLFDQEGDDLYRSTAPGFGSATFGLAYHRDSGGTDVYDSYTQSQGFARFGIGVLEDQLGEDRYHVFQNGQGCGLPLGAGFLIDRAGDDTYVANDTVIDFPSPQSADHNVSMAQGAATGVRADFSTGQSVSGGVGLLFDLTGDDSYSAAVFGQGSGYWEGVGMLWDREGNDDYAGRWYVHGASAHFAIGYLEDEAGDDTYAAPMNMAQGAGHDYGIGILIDRLGDDAYEAPNLSFGAGNANGLGLFADLGGNDTYASRGITLGGASEARFGSVRSWSLTAGVFIDVGGVDAYPEFATWARNGRTETRWVNRRTNPQESQFGIFVDR